MKLVDFDGGVQLRIQDCRVSIRIQEEARGGLSVW
jgi:hypothetical protein